MAWKSLNSFSNSMKGSLVRFRSSHLAPNISNQLNSNSTHPQKLNIPVGALGIIYEVRGVTMFIGFGRDLKSSPRIFSHSNYAAAIQFYIDDINKLEIEFK